MSRIFLALSMLVVILLLIGNVHGFLAGDYNRVWRELQSARGNRDATSPGEDHPNLSQLTTTFQWTQQQTRIHTLMGLFVSLVGILVQSLSITYFIGTGRWCKEVTLAYQLETDGAEESARWKRRCFPWALAGMTAIVAIAATGAAADPGTLLPATDQWIAPHAVVSVIGTIVVSIALARQYTYLRRNQQVIERIVDAVRTIRQAKGLEVD